MFRGTSQTQDAVAFRRWFFKLSELRFLVSDNIPFMDVTATATRRTEETIISVLRLGKFIEVSESPNRPISYLLVRPSSCQGLPQGLLFTKLDSLKDNLNTCILNSFPFRLSFLASLIVRLAENTVRKCTQHQGNRMPVCFIPLSLHIRLWEIHERSQSRRLTWHMVNKHNVKNLHE